MALARARYLGIARESGGWGVPEDPALFLEFLSCSVKNAIEKIRSEANVNSRSIGTIYSGSHDVGGAFEFEANPDNIGLLLFMALGEEANAAQVVGTQEEITEVVCEADVAGSLSGKYWTLDAPAAPHYVWYDVNGLGSTDPAIAGRTGIVVGIAPDADADAVGAATAAAIDALGAFGAVAGGAVTETVTITNAANGAVADATAGNTGWAAPTVTQQGSGGAAYDHVFTPADDGTDLESFTLEVGKAIRQFRYAGCKISSIQFSAAKGSVLRVTVNVLGKSEDDSVAVPGVISYSTKLAFVFDHGEVEIDGSGVAFVKSFEITVDNLPDAEGYLLDGTHERGSIEKQGLTVTGTMTLEYTATSYAERTAYAGNTTRQLTLVMTSTEAIEPGYYYTLTIDVPEVKYLEAGEDISGREAIPLTIGWEAIKPASGSVVEVTLRDALNAKWSA